MLHPPFTFFERDDSLLVNLDVDSGTGHVAGSIKEIPDLSHFLIGVFIHGYRTSILVFTIYGKFENALIRRPVFNLVESLLRNIVC